MGILSNVKIMAAVVLAAFVLVVAGGMWVLWTDKDSLQTQLNKSIADLTSTQSSLEQAIADNKANAEAIKQINDARAKDAAAIKELSSAIQDASDENDKLSDKLDKLERSNPNVKSYLDTPIPDSLLKLYDSETIDSNSRKS